MASASTIQGELPASELTGPTVGLDTICAKNIAIVTQNCLIAVRMDGKLHWQAPDSWLDQKNDTLQFKVRNLALPGLSNKQDTSLLDVRTLR